MAGWNGTGTYVRLHNWQADDAAAIDITSIRMDGEDDTIVTGLNNCLTKDGQNSPTQNLPMSGRRHTGCGAAVNRTDYSRVAEVQAGGYNFEATDTGGANVYVISLAPAISAYTAGLVVSFIPNADNTTACTLTDSGIGVGKSIKLVDGSDPYAGAISASGIAVCQYDGTNFVLLNPAEPNRYDDTYVSGTGTFDTGGAGGTDDDTIAQGLGTDDIDITIVVDDYAASNMAYVYALDPNGYMHGFSHLPGYTGVVTAPAAPASGNLLIRFASSAGGAWTGNYKWTARKRV